MICSISMVSCQQSNEIQENTIEVEQQENNIEVEQPEDNIEVEQLEDNIEVEQPEDNIEVEQPEDNIEVEQLENTTEVEQLEDNIEVNTQTENAIETTQSDDIWTAFNKIISTARTRGTEGEIIARDYLKSQLELASFDVEFQPFNFYDMDLTSQSNDFFNINPYNSETLGTAYNIIAQKDFDPSKKTIGNTS